MEMVELIKDFAEDLLYTKGISGDSMALEIWLVLVAGWEIDPADMQEIEVYMKQFLAENQDLIAAFLAKESKAMGEA